MCHNKHGFFLPYALFLFIFVLNMFIFVVLCSLNTNNYYNDKNNYYHIFILEERAKSHIKEKIILNQALNYETELIYYDEDFIYLTYYYDSSINKWTISFRINHEDIDEFGIITYDVDSDKLTIEIR